MSITKALMQLHGGTLEIKSAPGTGTTASTILPATRVLGATQTETPEIDPAKL